MFAVAAAAFGPGAILGVFTLRHASESGRWLSLALSDAFVSQLLLTLQVSALSAAVSLAGAIPLALALERYAIRGRLALEVMILSPLLFAPYTAAGAWVNILQFRFVDGAVAMAVQVGLASLPIAYLILRIALARLPLAYEEAARVCGHSAASAFFRVRLKLLTGPIAAGALFSAARAFGDYGCAARNGLNTFGVSFKQIWAGSHSDAVGAALAAMSAIPGLVFAVLCLVLWRRFVPQQPPDLLRAQAALSRLAPPWGITLGAWALAGLVFVLGFLVPEAWYVSHALDIRAPALLKVFDVALETFVNCLAVCAVLSLFAAVSVLAIRPGEAGLRASGSFWLLSANLFFPPMAFALAWVVASGDGSVGARLLGSWRDGPLLVIAAQCVKFAPFILLPVMDTLLREPPSARDTLQLYAPGVASRVWHTLRFHMPAIALGATLVFVESMKELELASTLQPFDFEAVSLKIHTLARFQAEQRIAPWALISQVMALPAIGVLLWRLRRDAAPPDRAFRGLQPAT